MEKQYLLSLAVLFILTNTGRSAVFFLQDSARTFNEDEGFASIRVEVVDQHLLISSVSVVLTPRVAPQDFTPLPDRFTLPIAKANAYPGRSDFSTNPVTLTFSPGGRNILPGNIRIIDDTINEALEYFVVDLSFSGRVPSTVSLGRSRMRVDIIDNDIIFIGFQLPNSTYPELEAVYLVTLIKGAGNVTEQEIIAVVSLVETVPPGTSFDTATPFDGNSDNDFNFGITSAFFVQHVIAISFPPDRNAITVSFDIFDDIIPENTEAAQLTLEVSISGRAEVPPPRIEILPRYPTFFIIIQDNDRKIIYM